MSFKEVKKFIPYYVLAIGVILIVISLILLNSMREDYILNDDYHYSLRTSTEYEYCPFCGEKLREVSK